MKKFVTGIIISFIIIIPNLASANFPSHTIQDSGKCLLLTTVDTGGGVYEYVTAPAGFGDDDQPSPAWYINSGTCTSGHTHNAGSQPDGTYTFTGAVSGAEDFYICSGSWQDTACGGGGGGDNTATSTVDQTQQNIAFSFLFFLAGILFIYKIFN